MDVSTQHYANKKSGHREYDDPIKQPNSHLGRKRIKQGKDDQESKYANKQRKD